MCSAPPGPPVILIVDSYAELSGAEVALVTMLKAWDHDRFYPIVAVPSEGPLKQKLVEIGVETHIVPMDPLIKTTNALKLCRYPFALGAGVCHLARLARARKASLIHTNTLRAHIYGLLAARLVRVPAVPYLRDLYPDGWVRCGIISLFSLAEQVIVNSRAVEETLRGVPRCQNRLRLIYPPLCEGFDTDSSPTRIQQEFSLDGCYPVVGLVAHLSPIKRHEDLIRAAPRVLSKFPKARFLLVGGTHAAPPGYIEGLGQLIHELGLEASVTFTGFRSDVAEFYPVFDALVLTSQGESFGKVLLEAMASETPVVATALGGPLEIVQDGVTGLLIPPCEPSAVADAILELACDPERARAMGRAGREWVKGKFAVDTCTRKIEDVFCDVLKRCA